MKSLPLEYKFAIEKRKVYLRRHPGRSQELAIKSGLDHDQSSALLPELIFS